MEDSSKGVILIIDDSLTNLKLLSMTLEKGEFEVISAKSGENGLEEAIRQSPDVILLDILMEGMDGFETCKRLKAHEATKDIPVIFMTVLSEPVDRLKGFEVGGVDYIVKPLFHEEVLARVNAHLTIRRQQKQLQEQTKRLEELNASKDKFFSIVSHDLQSPFEDLLHFTEFIAENFAHCSPEEVEEIVSTLRNTVGNLYELLKNLFTWASVQRGKMEYYPQFINVQEIVERNMTLFRANAEYKHVMLKNLIKHELPAYADAGAVYAIVRNLISNALKFTEPEGKVTIDAMPEDQYITISVADTGIGMEKEDVATLFRIDTKYQRVGTAGEEGTGLGLILCKELVEQSGGMLSLVSELGQGTTVTFSLPKAPVSGE